MTCIYAEINQILLKISFIPILSTIITEASVKGGQLHRGRKQRYSFQIDLDYDSSTLQFLQFWNQNVVNTLFLAVKSLKVTSGFDSKLMKKF